MIKNNDLAPICVFPYNRLEHIKRTIEALQKNELAKNSELFLFSDAAKDEKSVAKVNAVRTYLRSINGFKNVHIILRERNLGLSKSITDGVTKIVNQYGKVIVLEDDLESSPYFLKYMNEALEFYKNTEKVMSINGYLVPVKLEIESETFLYRLAYPWSWATWKRAWQHYIDDSEYILKELKNKKLVDKLDLDGEFRFSSTLRSDIRNKQNTWDIQWYASIILKNGLCLSPNKTLIKNIGHDGSGEHCPKSDVFDDSTLANNIKISTIKISENQGAMDTIKLFYKSIKPNIFQIIKNKLDLLIKKW